VVRLEDEREVGCGGWIVDAERDTHV
jgi:hypothetical protein